MTATGQIMFESGRTHDVYTGNTYTASVIRVDGSCGKIGVRWSTVAGTATAVTNYTEKIDQQIIFDDGDVCI